MKYFAESSITSDVKDLAIAACVSYMRGMAEARDLDHSLPASIKSQISEPQFLKRITDDEMSVIESSSKIRERGLSLARSGDLDFAEQCLDDARILYQEVSVQEEAILLLESLQTAAESYIHYRRREYVSAISSLNDSIVVCNKLIINYSYEYEIRRVHLLKNLIRVEQVSGNPERAMRIASFLVAHLEGRDGNWPISGLKPSIMSSSVIFPVRMTMMDQVLEEIAEILTRRELSREFILEILNYPLFEHKGEDDCFECVHLWLLAMRSLVTGDIVEFLNYSNKYFWGGPGWLIRSWRELRRHVTEVCRDTVPEVAAITIGVGY